MSSMIRMPLIGALAPRADIPHAKVAKQDYGTRKKGSRPAVGTLGCRTGDGRHEGHRVVVLGEGQSGRQSCRPSAHDSYHCLVAMRNGPLHWVLV